MYKGAAAEASKELRGRYRTYLLSYTTRRQNLHSTNIKQATMTTMNVSSSTKKPVLRRSIPYGAPYAYEKLVEKNSMQENSISVGSLSTILLSIENNRSVASSSEGDVGYSYSESDSESSDDDGRLGATPSKMRGVFPPKKRGGQRFPSISPVKSGEYNGNETNETLDIPGLSDWSADISRMTMPAMVVESGDDEAIAQDAYTTTHEEADVDIAFRQEGHNEFETSSPQNSDGDAIAISLQEQLESLGLRLESLERAIFSGSDDLDRTIDVDVGDENHDVAFIVEDEDSTVESLVNEITLLEEIGNNDNKRKTRRSKQSLLVRFFFFGGCRKL